jgi:hypothetical protein
MLRFLMVGASVKKEWKTRFSMHVSSNVVRFQDVWTVLMMAKRALNVQILMQLSLKMANSHVQKQWSKINMAFVFQNATAYAILVLRTSAMTVRMTITATLRI